MAKLAFKIGMEYKKRQKFSKKVAFGVNAAGLRPSTGLLPDVAAAALMPQSEGVFAFLLRCIIDFYDKK